MRGEVLLSRSIGDLDAGTAELGRFLPLIGGCLAVKLMGRRRESLDGIRGHVIREASFRGVEVELVVERKCAVDERMGFRG